MRYPEFLKENGIIGFIAPSFGCTTEPYRELFEKAIKTFEDLSYRTVLGPNCYADNGIGISNTPDKCGEEVNDFFINDRSDVIISCGGGELMCEDLPYIDFAAIAESKAKWYMGYSDNTNLTFLLNTLCDTASIYGPNAPKFGSLPWHESVTDSLEILKGNKKTVRNYREWFLDYREEDLDIEQEKDEIPESDENEEYELNETILSDKELEIRERRNYPKVLINEKPYLVMPYKQNLFVGDSQAQEINMEGRMIGGCLDCLVNLVGTRFDKVRDFNEKYKEDGIIWFLESCDLNVFDMRRALWHMENAGWFEHVRGFVIGRPLKYDDGFGDYNRIEAVRGILGKLNVPIVMDTDLGHLFPSMPVISGSIANIHAVDNNIEIKYDLR